MFTRLVLLVNLAAAPALAQVEPHHAEPINAQEHRMGWWREARFGLFIHWGLYAIPAGAWNGQTHHGEWIMTTAQIPVEQYEKFREQFNPVKFDADAWAALAAEAGMKYIVITSKHHDGFCLFDSEFTDYDVMSTPFKRDIMKELSAAARRRGLTMCWYHSIMDWHHPDYLPRRDWEKRSPAGADFERYRTHLKNQVRELLTRYGPIGVLWFDGEWEHTWTHAHGVDLFTFCREVSPRTIINNRVDKGRGGMAGLTAEGFMGDYGTPEQEVPHTGLPGVDWESCITMNDHWGYNVADLNYKSADQLIRMLVDIAGKGGNFLLNVGPTAEGEFPAESVQRLKEIGRWMKLNSASIYGTQAGPFRALPWGRCTQKPLESGDTRLFLHVFDWPKDDRLVVPGLQNEPLLCQPLAEMRQAAARFVNVERAGDALVLSLKGHDRLAPVTVFVLDIRGKPRVISPPRIDAPDDILIEAIEVTAALEPGDILPPDGAAIPQTELHYTTDGSEPTAASARLSRPIRITDTCTLAVRAFQDGKPISPTARRVFTKVEPRAALTGIAPSTLAAGLSYEYYEGEWERLPDFNQLQPLKRGRVESFSYEPRQRSEHFAFRFAGCIRIPRAGIYRFHLTSDDGSRLYVGDELVVDNDGLHVALTRDGRIALAAGWHPIRLEFFERSGEDALQLDWSGPGSARAPVPPEALAHVAP